MQNVWEKSSSQSQEERCDKKVRVSVYRDLFAGDQGLVLIYWVRVSATGIAHADSKRESKDTGHRRPTINASVEGRYLAEIVELEALRDH